MIEQLDREAWASDKATCSWLGNKIMRERQQEKKSRTSSRREIEERMNLFDNNTGFAFCCFLLFPFFDWLKPHCWCSRRTTSQQAEWRRTTKKRRRGGKKRKEAPRGGEKDEEKRPLEAFLKAFSLLLMERSPHRRIR